MIAMRSVKHCFRISRHYRRAAFCWFDTVHTFFFSRDTPIMFNVTDKILCMNNASFEQSPGMNLISIIALYKCLCTFTKEIFFLPSHDKVISCCTLRSFSPVSVQYFAIGAYNLHIFAVCSVM